jgi:cobalt-zinc-cadmium efflux system protein
MDARIPAIPHDHRRHDHSHDRHAHDLTAHGRLGLALAVTLFIALVEAVGGWWADSLALLGDAGHMLSDAAALGLAAFAAWIGRRPPTARHTYGYGRAETLAAMINSVAMIVLVVAIAVAAVERLQEPRIVHGGPVAAIALVGLLTNLIVLGVLSGGAHSLNTRGAMLHVVGDLLGSVAALLSGAVIYFTGWMTIDPILSFFIGALILFSTLRLLRESLHILLDAVPRHLDVAEIGRALAGIPSVASVHDLHVWTMADGRVALSAHMIVDDLNHWNDVLDRARSLLHERFHVEHATLQPEQFARIIPSIAEPGG